MFVKLVAWFGHPWGINVLVFVYIRSGEKVES